MSAMVGQQALDDYAAKMTFQPAFQISENLIVFEKYQIHPTCQAGWP